MASKPTKKKAVKTRAKTSSRKTESEGPPSKLSLSEAVRDFEKMAATVSPSALFGLVPFWMKRRLGERAFVDEEIGGDKRQVAVLHQPYQMGNDLDDWDTFNSWVAPMAVP